jgi:glutathione S-transferase
MGIKLYGMPLSNYYNMVKAVLIEKGMDFEEVLVTPNQEADYLGKSPMGKVPCVETEHGFLTETEVIIDYLDELGQGPSFYPDDPYSKAKVRELIRYLELYIELPARRLYGDVFFGRPADDALKAEVKAALEKGFKSLAKLTVCNPYLAGAAMSYADIYFLYSVALVAIVCKKALAWDLYADYPDYRVLRDLMKQRDSIKQVTADQAKTA